MKSIRLLFWGGRGGHKIVFFFNVLFSYFYFYHYFVLVLLILLCLAFSRNQHIISHTLGKNFKGEPNCHILINCHPIINHNPYAMSSILIMLVVHYQII